MAKVARGLWNDRHTEHEQQPGFFDSYSEGPGRYLAEVQRTSAHAELLCLSWGPAVLFTTWTSGHSSLTQVDSEFRQMGLCCVIIQVSPKTLELLLLICFVGDVRCSLGV